MTARVAVTGAGGFIGSHVVDALRERGLEVHAMARGEADLLAGADAARRLFERARPTHLIHLAWNAVPGVYWTSLENYRWVGATLELARAFRECGGERMAAAGTCAEYDNRFGFCREELTPLAPTTPYGVAKDATRRLLYAYGAQSGLGVVWGRIFFVYGPREQPQRLVPSVVRSLLAGEAPRCTEGRQVRDFLHVRDVAEAFVDAVLSDVGGAVNIASGEPVTVRELVGELGASFGAAAAPLFGAVPPRDEPPFIVGDSTRLRGEVGWRPRFTRSEGLNDTIEWWRAR